MDYGTVFYVLISSVIIVNDVAVATYCTPGYYCWLPPNETDPCPIYHTCNRTDPTEVNPNMANYLIPCKFGEGSCICKPGYNCTSGELNPFYCIPGSCAIVHLDLVEKPMNQTGYTTSNATFRCTATGAPAPILTWKRQDNRIIDFRERATLLNGSLTINDLVLEDEGTYVCVAENELRHTEASAYLKVLQSDVRSSDRIAAGSRKRVKRADCGQLAAPVDGRTVYVQGTTTTGSQATFSCNTGYRLSGPTTSDCMANGVWTNSAPTCTIVDCGPLNDPTNGEVNTDPGTTYGKVASYTCFDGYDLRGSLIRPCRADGNWGSAAPICVLFGYPSIVPDVSKRIAAEGFDSIIPCQNTGDPIPTVSWMNANGPLVINQNSGMELLANGSLLIKNTRIAHAGLYGCTATNSLGMVSRTFELAVFAIGSVMTDVEYQPYETGTVSVAISCNPVCGKCSPAQPSDITAVCTNCIMHMWTLRRCTGYTVGNCQHQTPLFAGNEKNFIFTPGDGKFNITDWSYIGLFVRAYTNSATFGMAYNIWKSVKQPICDIEPKSGIAMITKFNVSCSEPNPPGWVNYTCALYYQFPQTGETEIFTLPNTCNKTGLYLSPGDKDLFYSLDLKVTHRCEDKPFSSVVHILQVVHPDNVTKEIDNAVQIISNTSDHENVYERIERIHSATGLLELVTPETLKKDKTTSITDTSSAEFVKTTLKTEKTRLRGNLVEAISYIQTNTSMDVMKSAATALNQVILKKEEVSTITETKALHIYSSYIGQFSTIEQGKPVGEIKDIAQTLLGGVATMIDIATDQPLNVTEASDSGGITTDESYEQVKNKTEKLLGKVLVVKDIILDRQELDREATAVETSIMNIQLEKVSKSRLSGKEFKSQSDLNDQVTSVYLPSNINLPQSNVIRVESMFMKKNIYTWGKNSNIIKPPIMELNLRDDDMNALHVSNLNTPIKVNLKYNHYEAPSSVLPVYLSIQKLNGRILNAPTDIRPGFATFETNVTIDEVVAFSLKLPSGFTSCRLEIELDSNEMPVDAVGRGFRYPEDRCLISKVYGKLTKHDEIKLDNKTKYCESCRTYCCDSTDSGQCTGVYENCLYICNNVSQSNFTSDCSVIDAAFIAGPCQDDTSNHSDPIYIFPRKTLLSENVTTYTMYFRVSFDYEREEIIRTFSLSDEYCIGEPSVSSCQTNIDVKLRLSVTSLGCKFWDATKEIWSNNGLVLSDETTGDTITCLADHLTAFSTAVLVAPTFIDPFGDIYLFASFFENPVVVTGVITLWILYAFLVFWARRSDKADLEKVGVIYCADNLPSHTYCYLLCFVTALWKQSGTSANVFFYMTGTHKTSLKKRLTNSYRSCFKTGDEDWFLVTTEECLGDLESITIWHDNSGSSPHWYLDEVYVQDMQSNRSWSFINDDWLAVDRGHLLMTVTTLLPFSEADFKHKQKYSVLVKSTQELRDQHLWISIFSKPPKSHFTRVQRLSCALSLLLTTMLTNIMFYGIPSDDPKDQLKAGMFELDVTQFIIGIESSLMMFPIELVIVQLFLKLKPKPVEADDILELNILNDTSTKKSSSETLSDETGTWQEASELKQKLPPFPFSLMDELDNKQMKIASDLVPELPQDRRGRILPWWFLYIAWFVCISTCLVSSYLVMLYGLKFGYNKSVEWLISFVTGFFTNVIIQQPIQVFLITMVLVMIFKKYSKLDKDAPDLERVLGEKEELFPSATSSAPESHSVIVKPLHRRQIASIRERLRMEWMMGLKIQEAVLYVCYLIIVLIIVFGQGNINIAYHNIAYVKSMFVGSPESFPLAKVSTINEFYSFLEKTVVPRMDLLKNQTEENIYSDFYLVGTYRLRQLRVKRENCVGRIAVQVPCGVKQEYSWRAEDDKSYNNSWSRLSYEAGNTVGIWTYRSSNDLNTIPFPGTHATYSGGGYVVEMLSALSNDLDIVTSLKLADWIDDHTRAIFLEFTLYNPNVDLFTVAIYLFEFTNMGKVHPEEHLFTIKMYPFSQRYELFVLICELFFICFNSMFIWVEIGKLRKLGRKKYFANSWTYVDITHICLSISVVGLFLKKWAVVNSVKEEYRNSDRVTFINFYTAVLWDLIFSSFTAALLFVVTLMSTKVLQLNDRLRLIVDALGHVRPMVMGYMVFFTLITVTFAHTANLVFGKEIEGFKSMGNSFISIVCLVLREIDFKPMQEKFPGVGLFYVVSMTMLYRVMLIAISITVYVIGLREVKLKAAKKEKKLKLIQFLVNKIRLILNI